MNEFEPLGDRCRRRRWLVTCPTHRTLERSGSWRRPAPRRVRPSPRAPCRCARPGYGGGFRSRIQFSMRSIDARSSESGVAPAPIAALLFRSSTRIVVAVPVQPHPRAASAGSRATAGRRCRRSSSIGSLSMHLVGIEGVDAARPVRRPVVEPGVVARAFEDASLRGTDRRRTGRSAGRTTRTPGSPCGSPRSASRSRSADRWRRRSGNSRSPAGPSGWPACPRRSGAGSADSRERADVAGRAVQPDPRDSAVLVRRADRARVALVV